MSESSKQREDRNMLITFYLVHLQPYFVTLQLLCQYNLLTKGTNSK